MFFITTLFGTPFAKAGFVEGLEDIPLPNNASQIENGSLSFGNEEIRFFETYFSTESLSFAEIIKFYTETLPQMGWQKKQSSKKNATFERDGETLEISEESVKPLISRLILKSKTL